MTDNQNKGLSYLDMLTVLSVFLQLVTCQQVSNDTLLKELHRQDGYYLDKIMKDQKEILKMLPTVVDTKRVGRSLPLFFLGGVILWLVRTYADFAIISLCRSQ